MVSLRYPRGVVCRQELPPAGRDTDGGRCGRNCNRFFLGRASSGWTWTARGISGLIRRIRSGAGKDDPSTVGRRRSRRAFPGTASREGCLVASSSMRKWETSWRLSRHSRDGSDGISRMRFYTVGHLRSVSCAAGRRAGLRQSLDDG